MPIAPMTCTLIQSGIYFLGFQHQFLAIMPGAEVGTIHTAVEHIYQAAQYCEDAATTINSIDRQRANTATKLRSTQTQQALYLHAIAEIAQAGILLDRFYQHYPFDSPAREQHWNIVDQYHRAMQALKLVHRHLESSIILEDRFPLIWLLDADHLLCVEHCQPKIFQVLLLERHSFATQLKRILRQSRSHRTRATALKQAEAWAWEFNRSLEMDALQLPELPSVERKYDIFSSEHRGMIAMIAEATITWLIKQKTLLPSDLDPRWRTFANDSK